MGKTRRLRKKCQSKAKELKDKRNEKIVEEDRLDGDRAVSNENASADADVSIDPSPSFLLHDLDKAVTKSRKELKLEQHNMKKKIKRRLRHERLLTKLVMTQMLIKERLQRIQYCEKNNLNLEPTKSESTLLKLIVFNDKYWQKPKDNKKGGLKLKKKLNLEALELKLMSKLLKEKHIENPKTVTQYLKRRVAAEGEVYSV